MVGVRKKGFTGITNKSSKILGELKPTDKNSNDSTKVLLENTKYNLNLKMKPVRLSKSNHFSVLSVNSFDKNNDTGTNDIKRILRKRINLFNLAEKENVDTKRSKPKKVSKSNSAKNSVFISKINPMRRNSSIPVWKKTQYEDRIEQAKNVDVYDIALDEEMASEVIIKKKRPKPVKCNVLKHTQSKKSKNLMTRNTTFTNPSQDDINMLPLSTAAKKDILLPSSSSGGTLTQSSVPDTEIVMQPSIDLANPNRSHHFDNETFLLHLADEIERSFMVPAMTSTPSDVNSKPKDSVPKILDESYIPYTVSEHNKPAQSKVNKNRVDKEITLFESPTKEKKKNLKQAVIQFKSPQKSVQMHLFEENHLSPRSPEKLETSVLKPNKAYTPDNFKTHLVRSKKFLAAHKNSEEKKSKEQLLIEKMSQHFEEISGTDLCIE